MRETAALRWRFLGLSRHSERRLFYQRASILLYLCGGIGLPLLTILTISPSRAFRKSRFKDKIVNEAGTKKHYTEIERQRLLG